MYTGGINNNSLFNTFFMKKTLWCGVLATFFIFPLVSFAAEFRFGDQPSIQVNERVTDDVYIVGGSVTSAGSVTGDVVAGGGNVVISGAVGADIIAGGGNITILSSVGDDVRVGGGNILIQGKISGDVVAGGGQITIGGIGVGGDVALAGGSIRIDAPIAGDLRIVGGVVYINAPIAGTVTIEADTVTLGSAAVISGNLTYKATKELTKEVGAVVRGKVTFEPRAQKQISATWIAGLISVWVIGKFLVLLVSALIIGLMFRRYSKEVVTKATERPLLELGRGLIVFAALPVLSVVLCVTVVGIPFGIIGLLSFIIALLFAWIITPIIIGSVVYTYLSKRDAEISWKTILLGVFLYEILGFVPIIGWLAQMVLMLLALGIIAAVKWEVVRQWR